MGKRSKRNTPKPVPRVVAEDLPRVETADFDDPESHAVWAFCGLPHLKGAPMGFPIFLARKLSKRLWDCGFRYHPELRTIKYRAPHTGLGVGMLTSAGEWVPIDSPDPTPDEASTETRDALAALPEAQKQQIVNALGLGAAPRTDAPERVPYLKADGTTVMVTPAQARAWANAKRARKEVRHYKSEL